MELRSSRPPSAGVNFRHRFYRAIFLPNASADSHQREGRDGFPDFFNLLAPFARCVSYWAVGSIFRWSFYEFPGNNSSTPASRARLQAGRQGVLTSCPMSVWADVLGRRSIRLPVCHALSFAHGKPLSKGRRIDRTRSSSRRLADIQIMNLWQRKLVAFLYDPPHKPFRRGVRFGVPRSRGPAERILKVGAQPCCGASERPQTSGRARNGTRRANISFATTPETFVTAH